MLSRPLLASCLRGAASAPTSMAPRSISRWEIHHGRSLSSVASAAVDLQNSVSPPAASPNPTVDATDSSSTTAETSSPSPASALPNPKTRLQSPYKHTDRTRAKQFPGAKKWSQKANTAEALLAATPRERPQPKTIRIPRLARNRLGDMRVSVDESIKMRAFYPQGNRTAVYAMLARNGLDRVLDVQQFLDYFYPEGASSPALDAERKEELRKTLRGYATAHFAQKYPNADQYLLGKATLNMFQDSQLELEAKKVGLHRATLTLQESATDNLLKLVDCLGAKDSQTAAKFTIDNLCPRSIDWKPIIKSVQRPIKAFSSLIANYYTEPVVMRLLNESGRQSPMPIFVVGAFSGTKKLGEGFGQSLLQARRAAAMDGLEKLLSSPKAWPTITPSKEEDKKENVDKEAEKQAA